LDHGKVVEFGTPWELIKANGAFRDLVKQSGEENTLIEVGHPSCFLRMTRWQELLMLQLAKATHKKRKSKQ
jgi:hypothetical protein